MPTVNEILKQSGFTDDQIANLDQRALTAFGGVLTTAEQTAQSGRAAQEEAAKLAKIAEEQRKQAETASAAAAASKEAAEIAQRSNVLFYEEKIMPSLNGWDAEKQKIENARIKAESEAAFYRAQNEAAKAGGFVPTDAPGYVPPVEQTRNNQGQFVAGAPGGTPGSPTFTMEAVDERLGRGVGNIGWALQEYQRLSGGQFLPDSFDKLTEEATNARLPFRDYVARKYDFVGKQQAIQAKQQEEYRAKVAAEAIAPYEAKLAEEKAAAAKLLADNDKKWAERMGSNPDVKLSVPSKYAEVQKGIKEGTRPDPLLLNESQRRASTKQMIHSEIADNGAGAVA